MWEAPPRTETDNPSLATKPLPPAKGGCHRGHRQRSRTLVVGRCCHERSVDYRSMVRSRRNLNWLRRATSRKGAWTCSRCPPTRSPRFAELPARYNTTRMNRNDGPEDSSLAERCLTGGLPEFGGPTRSFRRILPTPGGISIFYDVGQGQGWQRNIVMNGSPHLPANIRQWYGDS